MPIAWLEERFALNHIQFMGFAYRSGERGGYSVEQRTTKDLSKKPCPLLVTRYSGKDWDGTVKMTDDCSRGRGYDLNPVDRFRESPILGEKIFSRRKHK